MIDPSAYGMAPHQPSIGMRSWTADVRAFGVVVRIAQVSAVFPLGSFQRSHIPANANNSVMMQFEKVWPSAATPAADGLWW
jgi:hypothetical protein